MLGTAPGSSNVAAPDVGVFSDAFMSTSMVDAVIAGFGDQGVSEVRVSEKLFSRAAVK